MSYLVLVFIFAISLVSYQNCSSHTEALRVDAIDLTTFEKELAEEMNVTNDEQQEFIQMEAGGVDSPTEVEKHSITSYSCKFSFYVTHRLDPRTGKETLVPEPEPLTIDSLGSTLEDCIDRAKVYETAQELCAIRSNRITASRGYIEYHFQIFDVRQENYNGGEGPNGEYPFECQYFR